MEVIQACLITWLSDHAMGHERFGERIQNSNSKWLVQQNFIGY